MMVTDLEGPTAKDQQLSDSLSSIASPVRISLLRQLRTPKILKEIKLYVPAAGEGPDHQRLLARQTVKEHLDRLVQVEAVVAREAERDRGSTMEYVVNQQRLFLLAEEFRTIARLRPVPSLEAQTVVASADGQETQIKGPCLVLVKGIDEGRTFPLVPPDSGEAQWLIGRRRDLDVPLDYDPYVSSENSALRWRDGSWTVEDLPESRNGTTRNFGMIPKARPTHLRSGDVIGVGRSLLLFHA